MVVSEPSPEPYPAAAIARRLMRLARVASLATLDHETRAPLATLVGVASDEDGAPLLFLSGLARHTHNLAADARASILLALPPERGDPLNTPRLSLSGSLAPADNPRRRERYLQRNPKSTLMMGLPDFRIHRLELATVHFNGGFGRADRLTPDDLLLTGDVSALVAAEPELLAEAQAMAVATLARAAGMREHGPPPKVVGLDAAGLDLSARGVAQRIDWPDAAPLPEDWRVKLLALGTA